MDDRPRITPRRVVGAVIALGALAIFAWALYNLMEIGTCASGGPFVSARECPDGVGLYAMALPAGVILGIAGFALAGAVMLILPLSFMTVGGASLASAIWGSNGGQDSFGYVFGGIFFGVGLLVLLLGAGLRRMGRIPSGRPGTAEPAGRPRIPLYRPGTRLDSAPPPPPPTPPQSVPTPLYPPGTADAPPPPSPAGAAEQPEPLQRLEQLERLAKLRRDGAITDAEYERLKLQVLTDR